MEAFGVWMRGAASAIKTASGIHTCVCRKLDRLGFTYSFCPLSDEIYERRCQFAVFLSLSVEGVEPDFLKLILG